MPFFLLQTSLSADNPVSASFFITLLALVGASIFAFIQIGMVPHRRKNAMLIVAIVTTVAAIGAYIRMNLWLDQMSNPSQFWYFDWFITVPLIVIEFYLLLKPLGASPSMMARLVGYAWWMLVFGFLGETTFATYPMTFGSISTLGMGLIFFEILFTGRRIMNLLSPEALFRRGYRILCWFLILGWAVYPLVYMSAEGNLLAGWIDTDTKIIIYNLADIFNKGGFCLVVYWISINSDGQELKLDLAVNRQPSTQAEPVSVR